MADSKKTDSGSTTQRQPKEASKETAPAEKEEKAVSLTSAAGTKVTAPAHMADGLKAVGFK
jgi:hypothetical protein